MLKRGFLLSRGANLADLIDKAKSRLNLGLGSAAVKDTGTGSAQVPTVGDADGLYPRRDSITDVGLDSNNPNLPYVRQAGSGSVLHLERKLGFTPVQQGGGMNMDVNKLYIGWASAEQKIRIQVDGVAMGGIFTEDQGMRLIANNSPANGVGTYAFLRSNVTVNPGDNVAASSLDYSNSNADSSSILLSGTWRCMGWANGVYATLFLRIS